MKRDVTNLPNHGLEYNDLAFFLKRVSQTLLDYLQLEVLYRRRDPSLILSFYTWKTSLQNLFYSLLCIIPTDFTDSAKCIEFLFLQRVFSTCCQHLGQPNQMTRSCQEGRLLCMLRLKQQPLMPFIYLICFSHQNHFL